MLCFYTRIGVQSQLFVRFAIMLIMEDTLCSSVNIERDITGRDRHKSPANKTSAALKSRSFAFESFNVQRSVSNDFLPEKCGPRVFECTMQSIRTHSEYFADLFTEHDITVGQLKFLSFHSPYCINHT